MTTASFAPLPCAMVSPRSPERALQLSQLFLERRRDLLGDILDQRLERDRRQLLDRLERGLELGLGPGLDRRDVGLVEDPALDEPALEEQHRVPLAPRGDLALVAVARRV